MMMYVWVKFIAFIISAMVAMNGQIANMKKVEKVEKETVQENVQINEPEVPKETEVVKKEPEEPVRYDDHVYVDDIDVRVVQTNPSSTYELQQIVDGPDAAAYQYSKCLYIGDHSNQNFATLPQVKVGDQMYWQGKTYTCYYADDFGYLDNMGYIRLSDGQQLYEQEAIALVTCKTNTTRYIRLFKEV